MNNCVISVVSSKIKVKTQLLLFLFRKPTEIHYPYLFCRYSIVYFYDFGDLINTVN